uniref:Uncharacterized protein n=1 Tax=Chrysotila carterae TaxID=13221 RepID=A0A7S4B6Q8_CHRCT
MSSHAAPGRSDIGGSTASSGGIGSATEGASSESGHSPHPSGHVGAQLSKSLLETSSGGGVCSPCWKSITPVGEPMALVKLPFPDDKQYSKDELGGGATTSLSGTNGLLPVKPGTKSSSSSSLLLRLTHRRATQACFLTPFPPKRGLSAQFWHRPQSRPLHATHLPQR